MLLVELNHVVNFGNSLILPHLLGQGPWIYDTIKKDVRKVLQIPVGGFVFKDAIFYFILFLSERMQFNAYVSRLLFLFHLPSKCSNLLEIL